MWPTLGEKRQERQDRKKKENNLPTSAPKCQTSTNTGPPVPYFRSSVSHHAAAGRQFRWRVCGLNPRRVKLTSRDSSTCGEEDQHSTTRQDVSYLFILLASLFRIAKLEGEMEPTRALLVRLRAVPPKLSDGVY